jgi:anhydro-N-acetylmuramic acid kinase
MKYRVLGLMSGTSLDGLDMVLCDFVKTSDKWNFDIKKAITIEYPEYLAERIKNALFFSVVEFVELDKTYGRYIANSINEHFKNEKIDFISSHGHTVIHFPDKNINFQIGDGATISAITGLPVVCDFRSIDIALGGQGAPLVPAAEKILFPEFDSFLNIGGFSNISIHNEKILAFDISPANYALNYFARLNNLSFDFGGKLGKKGVVKKQLLDELNSLAYYKKQAPKSLSDHWFYQTFLPIVDKYDISINNKIRTIYEHISTQIANNINSFAIKKIMFTGGGTFNEFLVELIKSKTKAQIVIPKKEIVDFKEAIIFAFLGLLRWTNSINIFASVTGAKHDNIGGAIYQAK